MPILNQEPSFRELKATCKTLESQVRRFQLIERDLLATMNSFAQEISRFHLIQDFSEDAFRCHDSDRLSDLILRTGLQLTSADCGFVLEVETQPVGFGNILAHMGLTTNLMNLVYQFEWFEHRNFPFIIDLRDPILKAWGEQLGVTQLLVKPLLNRQNEVAKILCVGKLKTYSRIMDPLSEDLLSAFDIFTRQVQSHYQNLESRAVAKRQILELKSSIREKDQASRMKDEFLATLSHELRTPLSVIQGHVEILLQEPECLKLESFKAALEAIVRNTQNQTQIINDLLDVSRIVTGKLSFHPAFVSPRDAVEGAMTGLCSKARAKGIRISHHYNSCTPNQIYADATRIQQIISNLLSNSIKFTPPGKDIVIETKRDNDNCIISVRDSGQGIEPAFLPFVFERFKQEDNSSTRKFGGLGLGLSIVKHLCELHGGHVRAYSKGKGYGSEFVVTLPIDPCETTLKNSDGEPDCRETEVDPHVRLDGKKILLVDDSEDNRKLISLILSKVGAQIETVGSAQQAREKMAQMKPDVIISDIGMPEEDGVMFMKWLRSDVNHPCHRVPSVALTAYVRSDEIQQILEAGFQTHVSKPVSRGLLIKRLHELSNLQ